MSSQNESGIERLKKKLYSRSEERLGAFKRRRLSELDYDVQTDWPDPPPKMPKKKRNTKSFLTGLLAVSIFFFVVSLALAAFFFLGGSTTVSSRNIDIEIQGPATIGGGEELSLQIAVTNRNATAVESADLLVEYPDGTRSASDLSTALPRHREEVGRIDPGERVERTVRAVLFGEEGSTQAVLATLEYRVAKSNAIFSKQQVYDLVLATAPLTIRVEAVEDLSAGQEAEFEITVASNSDSVIKNILLAADYPFGFSFEESSPKTIFTNNVWSLGDIEPEGKRTVILRGTLAGEDGEERVFRFATGIRSEVDETQLETAFVTKLHSIVIEKPFLAATLALDGNAQGEYVAAGGRRIRADIQWTNNLPTQLFDAEIEIALSGDALDRRSIEVSDGFYRSVDNTIIWTRETAPRLASLAAGENGSVSFSFASLGLMTGGSSLRNPEIALGLTMRGKRLSERNVPETVESSIVRRVKVATDLLLNARAVYFSGPFGNVGPLPPRVEQETTYTVLWTVTNSFNNVSDVAVTATLPSYTRFVGVVEPQSARVAFNDVGGQVSWNVGELEPGGKRDLAFQIAILPSISQVGSIPPLVNEQAVRGIDRFTRTEVRGTQPQLTTRLSTDPRFQSSYERVAE